MRIRARQAPQKNGGQREQALGRGHGGFSTKIHVLVDGLGNPLRLILTGGERNDITQAEALLTGLNYQQVIADKGYDADHLLAFIRQHNAVAVIPARHNRNPGRSHDPWLYRERHLVECFVNKIKHFRRVFSRFDKLASRFHGFLHFVSTLIWLR